MRHLTRRIHVHGSRAVARTGKYTHRICLESSVYARFDCLTSFAMFYPLCTHAHTHTPLHIYVLPSLARVLSKTLIKHPHWANSSVSSRLKVKQKRLALFSSALCFASPCAILWVCSRCVSLRMCDCRQFEPRTTDKICKATTTTSDQTNGRHRDNRNCRRGDIKNGRLRVGLTLRVRACIEQQFNFRWWPHKIVLWVCMCGESAPLCINTHSVQVRR